MLFLPIFKQTTLGKKLIFKYSNTEDLLMYNCWYDSVIFMCRDKLLVAHDDPKTSRGHEDLSRQHPTPPMEKIFGLISYIPVNN